MPTPPHLRLGTRTSELAQWQARYVARRLAEAGYEVELVPLVTEGDVRHDPIGDIGQTGVFTKELQRALLEGRIDLAVHSLKDLPTEVVPGLTLVAVPERDDPFDALISRDGRNLRELAPGATIGTGSLRRQSQLLHARPDLAMQPIRGNVDTRLRKLREGECDAIILAVAGLRRLALQDQITEYLTAEVMLPAIGQGALGVEARADDAGTIAALRTIDEAAVHRAVEAERSLLAALRGGCLAPIGAWGRIEPDGRLHLSAAVLSPDGRERLAAIDASEPSAAIQLGQRVADDLKSQGADALIVAGRGGR